VTFIFCNSTTNRKRC